MAAERDAEGCRVFRTLLQGERTKPYPVRQAVMQSSLVVHDVLDDPRCRRPADDHEHVLLLPDQHLVVPEVLEGRYELRARRIHPGHLVDEHDLASGRRRSDQLRKPRKRIKPACEPRALPIPVLHERSAKRIQLIAQGSVANARVVEGKLIRELLPNQICLADATPAIYDNKLRLGTRQIPVQRLDFFFSAYHKPTFSLKTADSIPHF